MLMLMELHLTAIQSVTDYHVTFTCHVGSHSVTCHAPAWPVLNLPT